MTAPLRGPTMLLPLGIIAVLLAVALVVVLLFLIDRRTPRD